MKVAIENSKVEEFKHEMEMCFNCSFEDIITWSEEGDFRTKFILNTQSEEEEMHVEIIIEELESK